jgi:microcystin-dependent protein
MAEPFIGEIRMFAGTFAPRGWAFCDGQLLAVAQNDALFSLLGTIYGGDGRTTFGLPDLRGRVPVHQGQGPGLSPYNIGSHGGQETVTLTTPTLAPHTHVPRGASVAGGSPDPAGKVWAASPDVQWFSDEGPNEQMLPGLMSDSQGGQAHPNMAPFAGIHFIIALVGLYPSRS